MDHIEDAMRAYQEAQKIRIQVHGPNDESVAAVSQYMGTMEFRSGDLDQARRFLEDFIRIRNQRVDGSYKDGDYVNVLFMIGNIHKIQGNDVQAKRNWSEAYAAFQELGLADENPQIARVMNNLLLNDEAGVSADESPRPSMPKKLSRRSGGMFASIASRVKGSLRDEKLTKYKAADGTSSRRSLGAASRRSLGNASSRRSLGTANTSRRSMR
jgi:tetratricopeptide (TPR) repeat protein